MKRIECLDVAKGIAIILVIVGHCYINNSNQLTIIQTLIYACHVPIFFIISGMLLKLKEKNGIRLRFNFIKYLKYYYIFTFIAFLFDILKNILLRNIKSLNLYITQLIYILLLSPEHMNIMSYNSTWFLVVFMIAEFIFFIIYYYTKNKINLLRKLIFTLIFIVNLFILRLVNHNFVFFKILQKSIIGLSFICIGYFYFDFIKNLVEKKVSDL